GDGTVTVNDVTVMQRFLAETEQELPLPAADVNGDGTVTVEDATLIQRLLAEFEAELS
ncbi:MAG: dockerin type I repeat-containing protein, partial [Ruminococcus sp.]|nr:dockerin type I repeat-containing protein [Ruminococcus sp.]